MEEKTNKNGENEGNSKGRFEKLIHNEIKEIFDVQRNEFKNFNRK